MEPGRRIGGKQFMWDGQQYPSKEEALEAARKYEADGFQVEIDGEDDRFHVFTRRDVKRTASEGR